MATKRTTRDNRKSGKTRKTDPEQISGISAAAIEGASESAATTSENAEKMARPRPGPGMDVGRQVRRGSPPREESHARESGTERDIETDQARRESSGTDEL
jgi:hypothetical protein